MAKSKKVIQKESVNGKKIPIAIEDPNSYYSKTPVWSFKIWIMDIRNGGLFM